MRRGTPLNVHDGAKMGTFSGVQMPLWYQGIRAEHLAVRTSFGLFDVSHMAVLWIDGESEHVLDALETVGCAKVSKRAKRGLMTYSMILNERGGIVDDVMMGRVGNRWLVVANASNAESVIHRLNAKDGIHVSRSNGAMIAIQGPQVMPMIHRWGWPDIPPFGVMVVRHGAEELVVSRTGYTGEDGVEVIGSSDALTHLWGQACQEGGVPCGLAARDSLRIEAGLPLYGHELSLDITPWNTRYEWVLSSDRMYEGRDGCLNQSMTDGVTTIGLRLAIKAIARQGARVIEGGWVTSGTLLPDQDHSIAMAMVPRSISTLGGVLHVVIRDTPVEATVVPLPFLA